MSEVGAPDLFGLSPDEARRACYVRDIGLTVTVADAVEVRGFEPARVRVTQQWPSPGNRMDSRTVVVLIDIVDDGDEAGVREPRRPSPPLRSPGVPPDESAVGHGEPR